MKRLVRSTFSFCRSKTAMAAAIAAMLAPILLSSCFFFTNKMAAALIRIYADDVRGQGIVIDAGGYVVTNAHTIAGRRAISAELKPGERLEFKVLCLNRAKDAAILRIQQGDYPAMQPATLGDSDLVRESDEISVTGYEAASASLVTTKGTVVALPRGDGTSHVQINVAYDPEYTGSAILNKAGEVIGMMTWNADQPGHEGYSLSSNGIQSLLAQAKEAEANPLAVDSLEKPTVTATSAVMSWKTNRPSSSQVEYGLQADTYAFRTDEDAALLTAHGSILKELQPDTAYHYRVRSVDGCGNEAVSGDQVFSTAEAGTVGKLTVTNVNVYDLASSAASVSWITNKPATSEVSYSSDRASNPEVMVDNTPVYEHKVRINGLDAEMHYFISVKSETKNESAESDASSITTPATAQVCCKVFCRVPDFDFKTVQDSDFSNVNISGKKTLMVFVKTSCSICMQQALFLNDYYKANPNSDVTMMLVASNEKKADVIEWTKKYGITAPVYMDANGDLVNTCKLRTIPSWFILDTGSIIKYYKSGGFGSRPEMEDALKHNL